MSKIFLVMTCDTHYNDETYEFHGGGHPGKAFFTREQADAAAISAAAKELGRFSTLGELLGSMDYSRQNEARLLEKLKAVDDQGISEPEEFYLDNLSDEQLLEVVKALGTKARRFAWVEEVEYVE